MKRQKRKTGDKKKQATATSSGAATPQARKDKPRSRRQVLEMLGYSAAGIAVVGGGGWYFVSSVQASIAAGDLGRIGNGTPTVVQIHDPQCPRCRALQREAREALAAFDDDELQYVVANIRQADGRRLADAHGVGHVTLLLFDAEGRQRGVLAGENRSDYLEGEFRRLIRRSPAS